MPGLNRVHIRWESRLYLNIVHFLRNRLSIPLHSFLQGVACVALGLNSVPSLAKIVIYSLSKFVYMSLCSSASPAPSRYDNALDFNIVVYYLQPPELSSPATAF